jgi:hypothetical protein
MINTLNGSIAHQIKLLSPRSAKPTNRQVIPISRTQLMTVRVVRVCPQGALYKTVSAMVFTAKSLST